MCGMCIYLRGNYFVISYFPFEEESGKAYANLHLWKNFTKKKFKQRCVKIAFP